jgi:hypothetical protein
VTADGSEMYQSAAQDVTSSTCALFGTCLVGPRKTMKKLVTAANIYMVASKIPSTALTPVP